MGLPLIPSGSDGRVIPGSGAGVLPIVRLSGPSLSQLNQGLRESLNEKATYEIGCRAGQRNLVIPETFFKILA